MSEPGEPNFRPALGRRYFARRSVAAAVESPAGRDVNK